MWFKRDRKDIAQLPVEIDQRTLRMIDRTDRDIRQTPKTLSQETQSHTLSGPGIAVNHRKPAFANLRMLDPPTEILDSWRRIDRLRR